jgi:hypothetical protein
MKSRLSRLITIVCLAAALFEPARPAVAQGIPEPSLILYGSIRNASNSNIRLTYGRINWQIRNSSTGRTVDVVGRITNIIDQFSYVLQVPCETLLLGLPVSSNALQLSPTPALFDRSTISLTVASSSYPATFVSPAQSSMSLGSTNRGRIERVDLSVGIPSVDSNENGMDDAWEINYFGSNGGIPDADNDGDGLSNLGEYLAGTDPTDRNSALRFVHVYRHPSSGVVMEWASIEGRSYIVERSPTLLDSIWTQLSSNITAVPPRNTYHDTNSLPSGDYFYRIRLGP